MCYAATGLSMRGVAAIARFSPRRRPGTIGDLTGSNLWPGRSGCIAMILHAQSSRLEPPPSGAESGCVRGAERKPHSGWSGRSGCIAMIPTRSNVQTRAAPKRRGVGLRARSGVEAALPPLWTLFTLRRGWGGADSPRRHPGTRKDPPDSDLWSGGSGCIAMLPTRANVQTRAAPKRRGVGLTRAKRSGCRTAARRRYRLWRRDRRRRR